MTTPTRSPDPTRPGRWCPEHGKQECAKRRKGGGTCHGAAITGLDACRMHAGQRGAVARAKGEALSAWRASAGHVEVSPAEAVMAMLQMSWARVHVYAALLERQTGADQGDLAVVGLVDDGEKGETIRGLAVLEAQERDRCVRYAKTAHDMGIADREIHLAEAQGLMLAQAIQQILDALDLTPGQRARVPEVVPGVLLAVGGGGGR